MAGALNAIGNLVSTPVVVVRVDEGTSGTGKKSHQKRNSQSTLIANIVVTTIDDRQKTGMQAFLVTEAVMGVKPRILGVPSITDGGVTTNLVSIAKSLSGFAYANVATTNVSDAISDRQNLSSREFMPIFGDFTGVDTVSSNGGTLTIPSVAVALGLRARINQNVGWHRCISNVSVDGVTGVTKPYSWNLQATGTDSDQLNQNQITALIRRNGYRFWVCARAILPVLIPSSLTPGPLR
ncbi:phage tail sheath subtilisin-like domain-containing protein [Carnimonas bestiolae]|uniref:phage tail sheath subtilisin-like domain-containing protein n=1 Tax=Carnimonas bestiolae TaxID=3402172 RepID=UPI003EDCA85B